MITMLESTTVHTTPNAEMRRYPGSAVAVWRTTSAPGSAGPVHVIDREQVVVVLDGTLTAVVDGETYEAAAGDAVLLPAGATRQLRNDADRLLVTHTSALPGGQARVGDGEPITVPWSA